MLHNRKNSSKRSEFLRFNWEESVNRDLKEWSKKYENVKIIDWHKKAKGKKDLFYKDAVHPNKVGAKLYAEFIHENL